jgi:transposase InsO family protein
MAILELRAARGWNLEQAADTFLLTAPTIASWIKRVDEEGPDALVQMHVPVNRFPDFVRDVVQRLKTLCPSMGKVKIAEILARAGLHIGVTTVGRILKEKPVRTSELAQKTEPKERVVTSKYPNHVWLVDLTTVSTGGGFWCSWLPFALPQRWPFCWWVGVIIDHFSRRVMGFATFDREPDAVSIRCFLARAILQAGRAPRHLISDKGKQFWPCAGYQKWCQRRGIQPRFGAVGQRGSIAVVERFILTMKQLLSGLTVVPLRRVSIRRELTAVTDWYNEHRPHMTLGGKTPNELYHDHDPANRRPRLEPREGWPRGSPCARPWALVAGKPGDRFSVKAEFHAGSRRQPIVSLKRAA